MFLSIVYLQSMQEHQLNVRRYTRLSAEGAHFNLLAYSFQETIFHCFGDSGSASQIGASHVVALDWSRGESCPESAWSCEQVTRQIVAKLQTFHVWLVLHKLMRWIAGLAEDAGHQFLPTAKSGGFEGFSIVCKKLWLLSHSSIVIYSRQ